MGTNQISTISKGIQPDEVRVVRAVRRGRNQSCGTKRHRWAWGSADGTGLIALIACLPRRQRDDEDY